MAMLGQIGRFHAAGDGIPAVEEENLHGDIVTGVALLVACRFWSHADVFKFGDFAAVVREVFAYRID